METSLILVLLVAVVLFILDGLKAREIGISAAKAACQSEGLLFLDETVVLRGMRPGRNDAGRLHLRRNFEFEFSDTGNNRRVGSITLHGHEVTLVHTMPRIVTIASSLH